MLLTINTRKFRGRGIFQSVLTPLVMASLLLSARVMDAQEQRGFSLEEIVVTAQKKAENIQEIPGSVSSLDGESLTAAGVVDVYDLQSVSPNLVIGRDKGSANIYIRGVGNSFVNQGVDGSVAVHQDGVYLSRPRGQVASFYDIERIEVLRGPQGSLYGRNATGGSVNIITKGPTDEFSGDVRVTGGSEELVELEGGISGPLTGNLAGRLAVTYVQQDGFGKNVTTGNDVLDRDEKGLRGKLRWDAGENLRVKLEADFWEADDHAFGSHFFSSIDHPLDGAIAVLNLIPIVDQASGAVVPNPHAIPYVSGSDDPGYFWDVASDLDFKRNVKVYGGKIDIQWDINSQWQLRTITGYRNSDSAGISDVDSTALTGGSLNENEKSETISQEIQLSYISERQELLAGFYFFDESQNGLLTIPWVYTGIPGDNFIQNGTLDSTALAAFLNYTYRFTDRLSFTLGGRYSYEKKDNTGIFFFQNLIATSIAPPGAPFNSPVAAPFPFDDTRSWDAFTPRFTADYSITDDTLAYVSISRGFKSGQFSLGDPAPAANPEFLWSYEIGLKSRFWGDRAQANISAFYYDYSDIQFQVIRTGALGIENVASAEVYGVEAETAFLITEATTLDFNIGIMESEYRNSFVTDQLLPPGTPDADISGNRLVQAPDVTAAATLTHVFQPRVGDLTFRLDYRYVSKQFSTPFNRPLEQQKGYSDLGIRVTFEPRNFDNWGISFWGRNLTDEEVKLGITTVPPWLGANQIGGVNAPRHYGADLTYRF